MEKHLLVVFVITTFFETVETLVGATGFEPVTSSL